MKITFLRTVLISLSVTFISCSKNQTAEQHEATDTASIDSTQSNDVVPPQPTETSTPSPTDGPKADVHLMGWSKDGKILAYRAFSLSEAIARHSYINVEIINLVDDKTIWSFSKNWQEDNVGEGSTAESSPVSGEEAWERVAAEVAPTVDLYGFDSPSALSIDDSYDFFPISTDDGEFQVEVISTEEDVKIDVIKNGNARKTVYERKLEPGMFVETTVAGCFVNPQRNRIAIVVNEYNMNMNNVFYSITGCLLTSGF